MQSHQFNLINIAKTGLKYQKHILIITLIGFITGVIISFLIKPKYEAFTIFFTPATNSISKSILSDNNLEGLMKFGDEEQIDQVLEMLLSDGLKDKVITKFNLIEHYGMRPDEKYAKTKARKKFTSNTDFKRTDFLAVRVSVTDENPVLAAEMANYISLALDSMRNNILQSRAKQAFNIISSQYQKKQSQVDSILYKLSEIREQGVFDYKSQSEVLSEAYIKAQTQYQAELARVKVYEANKSLLPDTTVIKAKGRLEAAKATYNSLRPTVENFGKLSGKYLEYETLYDKEKEALANLQLRFENAEVDFKKSIAQNFLIEKAQVPEKNAYPNKLLITFLSTLSAFIIAMLIACYNEFILPKLKA